MAAGKGKSFSPEENDRIRAAARALLERAGNNQSALAKRLGVSQPTVSDFVRAVAPTGAGVQFAQAIAREAGLSLDELTTGRRRTSVPGAFPRYRDMPGWDESVAEARRLYGNRLPGYAWDVAGEKMGSRTLAVLNPITVFNYVNAVWEMMGDDERAHAIAAKAEREMDSEDAEFDALLKARHAAREAGALAPPLPDDPPHAEPANDRKRTGPAKAARSRAAR